ncbi:MAG: hypothetical protein WD512_12780 [Candidatus Paceibacterota bacterium]
MRFTIAMAKKKAIGEELTVREINQEYKKSLGILSKKAKELYNLVGKERERILKLGFNKGTSEFELMYLETKGSNLNQFKKRLLCSWELSVKED